MQIELTSKSVAKCYFIIVFFFILSKWCSYINVIMFSGMEARVSFTAVMERSFAETGPESRAMANINNDI